MTVQCITCVRFSLRDAGRLAREGFGRCAEQRASEFMSATFRHNCRSHVPLGAQETERRRAWLEARR